MGTVKQLTAEQKALLDLQGLLTRHKDQIEMALPKHLSADRMLRVALTAATTNPALLKCDARSIAACIVQAAILGLEPNTPLGEAYLIPFKGLCQLVPGYKGLLKLVRNSGELVMVNAQEVRQNDTFDFEDGLDPCLRHKRAPGGPKERGPVVAYWAGAVLKSGGRQFVVLMKEEVEAHAKKYSKAFNNGPWQTEFDQMALKTCLRKLCKFLPASVEAQTACSLDEQEEVGVRQQFSPEIPLALLPALEAPEDPAAGEPTPAHDGAGANEPPKSAKRG
jgi:recombination protein RecT